MKPVIFACATVLLIAAAAVYSEDSLTAKIQDNIFRISVGPRETSSTSMRDLQERVWALERAVYQLQNRVYDLTDQLNDSRRIRLPSLPVKTYSCYITTPFDGTFTGTGSSIGEAKGKALKACSVKNKSSIFCSESKLKCDD